MRVFLVAMAAYSSFAWAHAGTYTGKGTIGVPGKPKQNYQVKFVVTDVVPEKVMKLGESYDSGDGKPVSYESVFTFDDNGTLKIERNGVKIGCGYCLDLPNQSRWCDYRQETEMGPLHVNMYYDGAHQTLSRLGDIITLDGPKVWNDSLALAK